MNLYIQKILPAILTCFVYKGCISQNNSSSAPYPTQNANLNTNIITGAERLDTYLPLIQNKRVGIFANQTSLVGNTHLVDTLRNLGVEIKVIFGPEHGFRGKADDGDISIKNYIDKKTGIPVVSLYGEAKKRSPTPEILKDIDILIYDIQDVGVRFYTFISSLQYYMEAAFENSKPLLILDRPNPNGFYVDGPVLNPKFKSFIGTQPIPIVYGMTIGEYAMMIAGERWLTSDKANKKHDYYKTAENSKDTSFHFLIIKNKNYDHKSKYVLPVRPSPNLPEIQSIYLYPSICLFEGTVFSEGRGTDKPFQKFGHPLMPKNLYSFVPKPMEGAQKSKNYHKTCYGWYLGGTPEEVLKKTENKIQIKWLIQAYKLFPGKNSFFIKPLTANENYAINKLAGYEFMKQIKAGKSEEVIRKSWEPALSKFKKIRKKYLLYPDFE